MLVCWVNSIISHWGYVGTYQTNPVASIWLCTQVHIFLFLNLLALGPWSSRTWGSWQKQSSEILSKEGGTTKKSTLEITFLCVTLPLTFVKINWRRRRTWQKKYSLKRPQEERTISSRCLFPTTNCFKWKHVLTTS